LLPARRPLHLAARPEERADLLADVAEMYYLDNKKQNEIARVVGVTRSMVSRMLSEARERGIVEISIRRKRETDSDLERELLAAFSLRAAHVAPLRRAEAGRLLPELGALAARVLAPLLAAPTVLGLAWGTSVGAAVAAFPADQSLPIKIVQLVGALGARNNAYDGHGLVSRMAEKTGGEAYYLNAPCLCPDAAMVASLLQTPSIRETVRLNSEVNVLLAGIGSTVPEASSFYLAGYMPLDELLRLRATGAVGDVCGLHFDRFGRASGHALTERLVTIQRPDLLAIPVRIGVAGGPGKAESILGAVRGGYINVLVTDSLTARQVLDLAQPAPTSE
jgi:DNA-binding transcriptional regulator LsrR (DeoR family)